MSQTYIINQLVEKPNVNYVPTNLAIIGRYFLTPDIFDKIRQTEPEVDDEIQLKNSLSN